MNHDIDFQTVSNVPFPQIKKLVQWVEIALQERRHHELTIRIVDEQEMIQLNGQYRGKFTTTNVLSFPAELPEGVNVPLLGDIVICAPVVNQEARDQEKNEDAHWAHIIIHGVLHLLGYDHVNDVDAEEMEALEVRLLEELAYPNPYTTGETTN